MTFSDARVTFTLAAFDLDFRDVCVEFLPRPFFKILLLEPDFFCWLAVFLVDESSTIFVFHLTEADDSDFCCCLLGFVFCCAAILGIFLSGVEDLLLEQEWCADFVVL